MKKRAKRLKSLLVAGASLFLLTACGTSGSQEQSGRSQKSASTSAVRTSSARQGAKMHLYIGNKEIPVKWESNDSVAALKKLLPLTISMSKFGGFEQVGSLGHKIVSSDRQTKTKPGDIVLYSSRQLVMFYGTNSWAYTRLGHIDLSKEEIRDLLDRNNVTVTLK